MPTVLNVMLLLIVSVGDSCPLNDGQGTPSPRELVSNWNEWQKRISAVKPMKFVRKDWLGDGESRKAVSIVWSEIHRAEGYYCVASQSGIEPKAALPDQTPQYVTLFRADRSPNYLNLGRLPKESEFMVIDASSELNDNQKLYLNSESEQKRFAELLFDLSPWHFGPADSYSLVVKSSSDSAITLVINTPNAEKDHFSRELLTAEVTFSREQNWLPTIVSAKYKFATDEIGTWTTHFSDWRQWEDFAVPFKQELVSNLGIDGLVDPPFGAIKKILEVKKCDLGEVKRRCRLSFYGFESLDKQSFLGRKFLKSGVLVLLVCAFVLAGYLLRK